MKILKIGLSLSGLILISSGFAASKEPAKQDSIASRVNDRDYPSTFMAWYNIDMPKMYPLNTEDDRIKACAKHDLMWEEPLSQLGEKVNLVLGLVWDHQNHGLATSFTKESLERAQQNKKKLLEINPNMVCLFEVRWRDAPKSFLPENSNWWMKDTKGEIVKGWPGGWEPFLMLNYENEEFLDNVARQAKIAVECGVYDGIMLDWSGNLEVVKHIRAAIGNDKLLIVNVHDDIKDAKKYQQYINGSFMELNPIDTMSMPVEELVLFGNEDLNGRKWENIENALLYYEENFQLPRINCLEVWGNRNDLSRMRATSTLVLTHSDGYVLYADPNPLATPDHYHDWYSFWDFELGKPLAKGKKQTDNSWEREFEKGTVIYNSYNNNPITKVFRKKMKRISDGTVGKSFFINRRDGDIFIPLMKKKH